MYQNTTAKVNADQISTKLGLDEKLAKLQAMLGAMEGRNLAYATV